MIHTMKEVKELLRASLPRCWVSGDTLSAGVKGELEGRAVVITTALINAGLGIHGIIRVDRLVEGQRLALEHPGHLRQPVHLKVEVRNL